MFALHNSMADGRMSTLVTWPCFPTWGGEVSRGFDNSVNTRRLMIGGIAEIEAS